MVKTELSATKSIQDKGPVAELGGECSHLGCQFSVLDSVLLTLVLNVRSLSVILDAFPLRKTHIANVTRLVFTHLAPLPVLPRVSHSDSCKSHL